MRVLSMDLKTGGQVDVLAYSPTLGWKDVGLSVVQYVTPPQDGIQEVILLGTPPSRPAPTSIELFPLSADLSKADWLKGVRVLSVSNEVLETLFQVSKKQQPIGKDWVGVESGALMGDKIVLEVVHPGGCRTHNFQLDWDGLFMKSMPPQISLGLSHNANGDPCEALIRTKLSFDISPVLENPGENIIHVASPGSTLTIYSPSEEFATR